MGTDGGHWMSLVSHLSDCPLLFLLSADAERGVHDGTERTCSGLYIWRCHVRFSGAAKLGDAFKSKQLPFS